MEIKDIKDPQWANAEKTLINCLVNFDHLAEDYVPFTASETDVEEHGREIYALCLAEKFGKVGEFMPPPPFTDDQKAVIMRTVRDELLKESDWTQLPDVPQALKAKWATYRQQLRDITKAQGFPNVDFPIKPN